MVYESKTWSMKVEEMQSLKKTERIVVRWMYDVALKKNSTCTVDLA